jgi:hypothetical protein
MAREFFIFLFCATIAFFLGNGYYDSFRSGVLTVKGRSYRRDEEPTLYWISLAIGTFAFLILISVTAIMAFVIFMNLLGTSR